MNQEQFEQFWIQLQAPLKEKWIRITDEDLQAVQGNLVEFTSMLQKCYGELQRDEVMTWANRRYSHWTGNYAGYKDPA